MSLIPDESEVMATRMEDYVYGFFGQPGVGKTTFVEQLFGSERTLFISTDRGTRDMDVRRVECNTWLKVLKVFKQLAIKPKGIEVLCFDHIDDFDEMISSYVCKYHSERSARGEVYDSIDAIPHGKGWFMYKNELKSLINRTLALGVCPVFIAHEDIKVVKSSGREVFKTMPAMGKMMQRYILPVTNILGQITIRRMAIEKGGKKRDRRILVTQPTEELYTKDRTKREKPERGWELLDAEQFRASFETARRGRRAKH